MISRFNDETSVDNNNTESIDTSLSVFIIEFYEEIENTEKIIDEYLNLIEFLNKNIPFLIILPKIIFFIFQIPSLYKLFYMIRGPTYLTVKLKLIIFMNFCTKYEPDIFIRFFLCLTLYFF